jgi:hypothetical protein
MAKPLLENVKMGIAVNRANPPQADGPLGNAGADIPQPDSALNPTSRNRKTPRPKRQTAWETIKKTRLQINGEMPNSPQLARALVRAVEKYSCETNNDISQSTAE